MNKKEDYSIDKIAAHDSSEIGAKIANLSTQHDKLQSKDLEDYFNNIANKYDAVRYKNQLSFNFNTSPASLMGVARLFGVNVKKDVRYLEIGCGIGSNIIAIANSMPNSEFIGIDLSESAIEDARKYADELNLTNLEFHSKSFTKLTQEEFGKFDIIVLHDVFSWLKPELRGILFDIIKSLLNENGLFYVNYNVSPGWYLGSPLIEYLNSVTKNMPEGEEKRNQVALHLKFLNDVFANKKTPYAMAMMQEIQYLMSKTYSYLIHNHLEQYPINFLDMHGLAVKHGMQYLSETNPSVLLIKDKGLPKEVEELNNLINQQWYLDVCNGTRFRSSIFVHVETKINRNINVESIREKDLSFICNISPIGDKEVLSKENIMSNNEIKFRLANTDQRISHNNPLIKACLLAISNYKSQSSDFDTTVEAIRKEYGFDSQKISEALGFLIQNYIFSGIMVPVYNLHWKRNQLVSEKPKLNDFAKKQLERGEMYIVGSSYSIVPLDLISKHILLNCNGSLSIKEIEDLLLEEFEKGTISCNIENKETKETRAMTIQEVKDAIPGWAKYYTEMANFNGLF